MSNDNFDQQLQQLFSQSDKQKSDDLIVKNIMTTIKDINKRRIRLLRLSIFISIILAIIFFPFLFEVVQLLSTHQPLPALLELTSNSKASWGLVSILTGVMVPIMFAFYYNPT